MLKVPGLIHMGRISDGPIRSEEEIVNQHGLDMSPEVFYCCHGFQAVFESLLSLFLDSTTVVAPGTRRLIVRPKILDASRGQVPPVVVSQLKLMLLLSFVGEGNFVLMRYEGRALLKISFTFL